MGGPAGLGGDETIRRAIEIRDGVVLNPKILSFQHAVGRLPAPRRGLTGPPQGSA